MKNEEIKEILQKIESVANRETASRNSLMEMKDEDYQLLLDYITNLQEEFEYSKIRECSLERKVERLEQELQRKDNIIEGLKGYVEMCINTTCNMNNDNYTEGRYNAYCDILDKLKELKEGNK